MQRIRQDIRLTKREKEILENISENRGMNVTEYIKQKLFVQNPDLIEDDYIYHCPSGERYNYAMAGISMSTYWLLEEIIKHMYQDNSVDIIGKALAKSTKHLAKYYKYTKSKIDKDE